MFANLRRDSPVKTVIHFKRSAVFLSIALLFLVSCGQTQSLKENSSEAGGVASEQAESISETEKRPEQAADAVEAYAELGGTWEVGGIYYEGHLIDIHENDALESLYDTTLLTFNEDGSFVYLKTYNNRGSWTAKDKADGESFILKTESVFRYSLKNGSLVEEEIETDNKTSYIVSLMDENTLALAEYDFITGRAKADEDPLILVKQDESSRYIAENKTSLKTSEQDSVPESQYTAQTSYVDKGSATSGEKNALAKALQYLDYTAFSYSGLIEQLEYEGFSNSEAKYGADNCGADWNEQAYLKARKYLDYSAFSKSGLIDQLLFEGFTQSQAEYGAEKAY